MLKEIIALWKGENFMKQVVIEFGNMIGDAEYVFNNAWRAITGQEAIDKIRKPLHDRDAAVNQHERDIRRKLLEHLSINPRQDVSGCLAIMSLVKDAERIGDYSKNIFDLAIMLQGAVKELKYLTRLSVTQDKIATQFPKLKKAFLESDEKLAKEILKKYGPIKEECNETLQELFADTLSTKEAVATALASRYLKRINSHVSNIASGIVLPLDKIDFVRGDLLE
ncbi:MAG: PhoU domain-containing protein [Candidatus Omnitrophota bacterium]